MQKKTKQIVIDSLKQAFALNKFDFMVRHVEIMLISPIYWHAKLSHDLYCKASPGHVMTATIGN